MLGFTARERLACQRFPRKWCARQRRTGQCLARGRLLRKLAALSSEIGFLPRIVPGQGRVPDFLLMLLNPLGTFLIECRHHSVVLADEQIVMRMWRLKECRHVLE